MSEKPVAGLAGLAGMVSMSLARKYVCCMCFQLHQCNRADSSKAYPPTPPTPPEQKGPCWVPPPGIRRLPPRRGVGRPRAAMGVPTALERLMGRHRGFTGHRPGRRVTGCPSALNGAGWPYRGPREPASIPSIMNDMPQKQGVWPHLSDSIPPPPYGGGAMKLGFWVPNEGFLPVIKGCGRC